MTIIKNSAIVVIRNIAVPGIIFLLITITSFGQQPKLNANPVGFENEWWYPIIQKHKIDLKQFNYRNSFTMVKPDTTYNERWFELGKSDSLNNRNIPFKDAILISTGNPDHYCIIKSPSAHHDFDENTIVLGKSTIEFFRSDQKDNIPVLSDTSATLRININTFTISRY